MTTKLLEVGTRVRVVRSDGMSAHEDVKLMGNEYLIAHVDHSDMALPYFINDDGDEDGTGHWVGPTAVEPVSASSGGSGGGLLPVGTKVTVVNASGLLVASRYEMGDELIIAAVDSDSTDPFVYYVSPDGKDSYGCWCKAETVEAVSAVVPSSGLAEGTIVAVPMVATGECSPDGTRSRLRAPAGHDILALKGGRTDGEADLLVAVSTDKLVRPVADDVEDACKRIEDRWSECHKEREKQQLEGDKEMAAYWNGQADAMADAIQLVREALKGEVES